MRRAHLAALCLLLLTLSFTTAAKAATPGDRRTPALAKLERMSAVPLALRFDQETGKVSALAGSWSPAAPGRFVESSFRFLEQHRSLFGITSPRDEFVRLSTRPDGQLTGWRNVYLQQSVHGVPVLHQRLAFHFDGKGRLVGVDGDSVPTPSAIQTPKLTGDEAMTAVLHASATLPSSSPPGDLAAALCGSPLTYEQLSKPRLVYFRSPAGGLRLAYAVSVTGTALDEAWTVVVDARSGAILARASDVATAGAGIDLTGKRVKLQTTKVAGVWKLIDRSRHMYRRRHTNHPHTRFDGCIEVRDARHKLNARGEPVVSRSSPPVSDLNKDNFFDHGGKSPKMNQRAAVSLARHLATTYETLRTRISRNSIDGKGLSVIGHVHVGVRYENAFWHGSTKMMYFGDNKAGEAPFSKSLDIVAHEYGHGVSQYSVPGGIVYMYPSGALSETFSDVWACVVDYRDWKMGEDLGRAIRDLKDPGAVADPLPANMFDYNLLVLPLDGGGNHINCGIGGHFFQQFSEALPRVPPAKDGRFTAAKILYRSYRHISSTASMRDWAFALRQSAVELYGAGSRQESKVRETLDRLGLSTVEFGQNDDGWCYNDVGALQQIGFGNLTGMQFLSVRFTTPPGAKLLRVYAALNKGFPTAGALEVWVNDVDGNPASPTYRGPDPNSAFNVGTLRYADILEPGRFTGVRINDAGGQAAYLDVGTQFFLTLGYRNNDAIPVLLMDSGSSPQSTSWALMWDDWNRRWTARPLQSAAGVANNLMLRPMYYYPSGVDGRPARTMMGEPVALELGAPGSTESLRAPVP